MDTTQSPRAYPAAGCGVAKEENGVPIPYERFFSTSQPIIEVIFRHSRNPYADLSSHRDLGKNWQLISFLLWYELFVNGNDKLFSRISKECAAMIDSAGYGFRPEFLSSCSVFNG